MTRRGLRSWVNYYTKSSTMPNRVVTVFALDEGGESEFKRIAATDVEFSRSTSSFLNDRRYFSSRG
ncbi:hypothetical protein [Lactobacillus delbrueckii]|uniref:Uncharacterized protein n=1 Tax=Lactobacillus delbrueckii subsp. lactis TaxID=29397 RepID=A0ABD4SFG7_LACDL|nr:hypothetical protein [Lactobacillus delbrueckii]MCD5561155.1 hypothetical protein [Lactobacillus delbrueckii subsp. lactis]MCD5562970.1 hypothetical protein [Lactobacillus delbrueckii subsp. lactis]